jgi:hypothetical protein
MQKSGIVISINLNATVQKQAGGTYNAWELVYKNSEGKVETFQKPVQGLKFNPTLKTQLEALSLGDEFTATLEKNAGGFWEVQSITKGVSETRNAAPSPAAAGKVTGSNYETPAERAARQVSIVRQSCLAQAVATLSVGAKAVKPEDVMALAEVYIDFINGQVQEGPADEDIPY